MTLAHAHIEIPLLRRESTPTITDNYVPVMPAAVAHFFSLFYYSLQWNDIENCISHLNVLYISFNATLIFCSLSIDYFPHSDFAKNSSYKHMYAIYILLHFSCKKRTTYVDVDPR
jgi:hypothetical protein